MAYLGRNYSEFEIKGDEEVDTIIEGCTTGIHDDSATIEDKIRNYYKTDIHNLLVKKSKDGTITCVIITNDPNVYFMGRDY